MLTYSGDDLKKIASAYEGRSLGGTGGYLDHEGEYMENEK